MLIRFKGQSDKNFKNGRKYQFVHMRVEHYIWVYIFGECGLIDIPYSTLDKFNENWEYIYDDRV